MTLLIILTLFIIDIVGFAYKLKKDKNFANYHLKKVPFIWYFYG